MNFVLSVEDIYFISSFYIQFTILFVIKSISVNNIYFQGIHYEKMKIEHEPFICFTVHLDKDL
jgi:hypothetical protein